MDQITRDLTYRLDALKSICQTYGFESESCQYSLEIWNRQHAWNVLFSKLSDMMDGVLLFIFFFIVFVVATSAWIIKGVPKIPPSS